MDTTPNSLVHLCEHELLEHFEGLVTRDRCNTAQLLVAIGEIDQRKLWAKHACSSMFVFCVERFHMSEQVTAKRIWAARTARRFPVILKMVERGELHLSAIHLLASHLTAHNCSDVLRRARHKSSREIERLVAELAPRPDVVSSVRALPRSVVGTAQAGGDGGDSDESAVTGSNLVAIAYMSATATAGTDPTTIAGSNAGASDSSASATMTEPASTLASSSPGAAAIQQRPGETQGGFHVSRPAARPITPLSPRRYKIEITVDEETHDKLRSLQDLVGRSAVGRDPAAIISRAIDVLLVDTLKRKAAITERSRPAAITNGSRPAAMTDRPRPDAMTNGPRPAAMTDQPRPTASARDAAAKNPRPRSRSMPAVLRRTVWRRDCGRCCYVDDRGRRCNATRDVEFHHKDPFARGGRHDVGTVELRCAAHNQYQADLDFGRDFMDARRGAGAPPMHSPRNVE